MGIPQVAIVGRPNVGKSSVLNWLVGKRIAVVDPTAGVTRDRVTQLVQFGTRFLELVDTGGMGIQDSDNLTEQIEEQIQAAIDSACVILLVVDTRAGMLPLDREVAKRLRYVSVPVLCVANKTDHPQLDSQADEFYQLGRKMVRISTRENRGKSELMEAILEKMPPLEADDQPPDEDAVKIAIVGRRNTGKSTLVNTLAQAERVIVSEVPGTTRDSIDVRYEMDGKAFIAIDTPGFRRGKSMASDVDFYSTHRAERAIRRADVVLLFFDASQRIAKADKQLCDYIAQQYKPCIFVVNKWDLMAGTMPMEKWVAYLRDTFRTMLYVPIALITGQTGKNVKAMLNHAQMLNKQSRMRVSTGPLNKLLRAALEKNPPPSAQNRQARIYYATQVAEQPPTMVLFCNDPKTISQQYQRYLLGVLRENLKFAEVPIKLYLRRREQTDERDEIDAKLAK
ncbi:MAG: ribosome biogenesis GTPase Der [Thermoguttaceae bacterium]|jgi:GTP-binding protein